MGGHGWRWRRMLSLLTDSLLSSSGQCSICNGILPPKRTPSGKSQEPHLHVLSPSPAAYERRLRHALCDPCLASIPWIRDIQCVSCGRSEQCPDCAKRNASSLMLNRAAVQYNEQMKEWLAAYKYRGHERLLPIFAHILDFAYEQLLHTIAEHDFQGKIGKSQASFQPLVTSVPIHPARLQERGFNQAAQLAVHLANRRKLLYSPTLQRVRHTKRQSMKTRRERLADLQGAFVWDEHRLEQFQSSNVFQHCNAVIIVDDVYTTGSTLHECADVLRQHLTHPVYGLTWAR